MSIYTSSKSILSLTPPSLTKEKLLELVNFLVEEPPFNASQDRCYKLPYVACEILCIDNDFVRDKILFPIKEARQEDQMDISQQEPDRDVLSKLFSFITIQSKEHELTEKLNPTLGGYLNKILSLWLIKKPNEMV